MVHFDSFRFISFEPRAPQQTLKAKAKKSSEELPSHKIEDMDFQPVSACSTAPFFPLPSTHPVERPRLVAKANVGVSRVSQRPRLSAG